MENTQLFASSFILIFQNAHGAQVQKQMMNNILCKVEAFKILLAMISIEVEKDCLTFYFHVSIISGPHFYLSGHSILQPFVISPSRMVLPIGFFACHEHLNYEDVKYILP